MVDSWQVCLLTWHPSHVILQDLVIMSDNQVKTNTDLTGSPILTQYCNKRLTRPRPCVINNEPSEENANKVCYHRKNWDYQWESVWLVLPVGWHLFHLRMRGHTGNGTWIMEGTPDIKCIFFSEFHTVAGPKITYQVSWRYLLKAYFVTSPW